MVPGLSSSLEVSGRVRSQICRCSPSVCGGQGIGAFTCDAHGFSGCSSTIGCIRGFFITLIGVGRHCLPFLRRVDTRVHACLDAIAVSAVARAFPGVARAGASESAASVIAVASTASDFAVGRSVVLLSTRLSALAFELAVAMLAT